MTSRLLDIALVLVANFWAMAVIEAQVVELVAGWRKWRANLLRATVDRMLGPALSALFHRDDHIAELAPPGRKPSYLEPETFARVLISLTNPAAGWAGTVDGWLGRLGSDPALAAQGLAADTQRLQGILKSVVAEGGAALATAVPKVAGWFQETMDRAEGDYRRQIRVPLVIAGLTVALVLDADLFAGLAAAASTADAAGDAAKNGDLAAVLQNLAWGWSLAELQTLTLPAVLSKVASYATVAVAGSLGAPFWFDLLKGIVSVRSAGRKPSRERTSRTSGRSTVAQPSRPESFPPRSYGGGSAPEAVRARS